MNEILAEIVNTGNAKMSYKDFIDLADSGVIEAVLKKAFNEFKEKNYQNSPQEIVYMYLSEHRKKFSEEFLSDDAAIDDAIEKALNKQAV